MGTMQLMTLMLCLVHVVYSADYQYNDKFYDNSYTADADNTLPFNAKEADTTATGNDAISVTFSGSFDLFGTSFTNVSICDWGYIYLDDGVAGDGGSCLGRTALGYGTVANRHVEDEKIITPFLIDGTDNTIDSYLFEARLLNRYDELSTTVIPSGVTDEIYFGSGVNELKRIAADIDDCNKDPRTTTIIDEALIVTWQFIDSANSEELVTQAIIAKTSTGKTYVILVYKDAENDFNTLGVRAYGSDGANAFFEACGATTIGDDLAMYSNCQCAQSKGIYIFDTSTDVEECINPTQCADDANKQDDTQNLIQNCRPKTTPDSAACKLDYYCRFDVDTVGNYNLNIVVGDIPFDNYMFINRTALDIDGTFDLIKEDGQCDGAILNNSIVKVQSLDKFSAPLCVEVDGNNLEFALWLYDDDELLIVKDGSRVLKGTCDITQLVNKVNDTIEFEPPFVTKVPKRVLDANLYVGGARTGSDYEIYDSTSEAMPGDVAYIYLCFKQSTEFNENADAYGIYGSSCTLSDTPTFDGNTLEVIGSDGCPIITDNRNVGYFQSGPYYNPNLAGDLPGSYTWCQNTGWFNLFKWVNTDHLYVRCYIDPCKNYDNRANSRCYKSCGVTNVNQRRKRQVADEVDDETTILTAKINIGNNYTSSSSSGKKCVDQTTAVATLSGLISALVIATGVAVVLFVKVQQRKRV